MGAITTIPDADDRCATGLSGALRYLTYSDIWQQISSINLKTLVPARYLSCSLTRPAPRSRPLAIGPGGTHEADVRFSQLGRGRCMLIARGRSGAGQLPELQVPGTIVLVASTTVGK